MRGRGGVRLHRATAARANPQVPVRPRDRAAASDDTAGLTASDASTSTGGCWPCRASDRLRMVVTTEETVARLHGSGGRPAHLVVACRLVIGSRADRSEGQGLERQEANVPVDSHCTSVARRDAGRPMAAGARPGETEHPPLSTMEHS